MLAVVPEMPAGLPSAQYRLKAVFLCVDPYFLSHRLISGTGFPAYCFSILTNVIPGHSSVDLPSSCVG